MKVLIVDDEPLARSELRYLVATHSAVDTIEEAEGVQEAEQLQSQTPFDLVFLDIQLEDGNGVALAKRWKRLPDPPVVIFATAFDQYALDAFDADAIDYILKPFDEDRVNEALDRVQRLKGELAPEAVATPDYSNPRLSVPSGERTMVVLKKQICYLEAQGGNVYLQLLNGERIVSRQTLASLTAQLDPATFLRVHRSYVVNLDQIREIQPATNHTYELTMVEKSRVPVSRSFVAELKQAIGLMKG